MTHLDEGTLHAYLDGELDDFAERQMESHLAACAQCAGQFDEAIATRALADNLLDVAAADEQERPEWARLVARSRPSRRWVTGLAWAATLLLAFTVGWQASRSGDLAVSDRPMAPEAAPTGAAPELVAPRGERVAAVPESPPPADGAVSDPQSSPRGDASLGVDAERARPDELPAGAAKALVLPEARRSADGEREGTRESVAATPAPGPASAAASTPSAGAAAAERRGTAEAQGSAGSTPARERRAPVRVARPPEAGEWTLSEEAETPEGRVEDGGALGQLDVPGNPAGVIRPWVRIPPEDAAGWLGAAPAELQGANARQVEMTRGPVLVPLDTTVLRHMYEVDGREVALVEQSLIVVVPDLGAAARGAADRRAELDGMPLVGPDRTPQRPPTMRPLPPGPEAAPYTRLEDGRAALRFLLATRTSAVELRGDLSETDLRALAARIR